MIAARSHRTRGPVQPRPVEKRADVVPYDYGATFRVIGRPGNVVQSVINTAPDSLFVAVAIGYGFEEDRSRAIAFDNSSLLRKQARCQRVSRCQRVWCCSAT